MVRTACLTFGLLVTFDPAGACEVARILFGDIRLDIVSHADYETAVVRHANFNDKSRNYGTLKGEITVERAGFAVRTVNQDLVGIITPSLIIEGGDGCGKNTRPIIKRVEQNVFVIMNGATPVGTVQGRFPKNDFGVR